MDGIILSERPIAQDPETQWKLLRRCPFGYAHLVGIIEALEGEKRKKEVEKEERPTGDFVQDIEDIKLSEEEEKNDSRGESLR